jgi:octaprenyl-diphosphate synthase
MDEYFKIISAKTGILISAACRIGAVIAGKSEKQEKALSQFGLKTGIAFQLADDILDYVARQKDLGKKLGKDLEEGKITMPLIQLLKIASPSEKKEVISIVQETAGAGSAKRMSSARNKANLEKITHLFSRYNVIEESFNIAQSLVKEAKAELSVFPDSGAKEAILTMADYTLQRKK